MNIKTRVIQGNSLSFDIKIIILRASQQAIMSFKISMLKATEVEINKDHKVLMVNKTTDNPQVYGIATIFEGRVFNPNLLIRHKGKRKNIIKY